MPMDFTKVPANEYTTFWLSPGASGALGITDIDRPLAAELNNVGGTSGVQNVSKSTSWNDFDFGTQASETTNQPSLADATTFEEFGQSNFGGSASHYYPLAYDDNSNLHSVTYDLVKTPGTALDAALRIDGGVKSTVLAADGDFVCTYRVQSEGEVNPFTPGEAKRYTKNYIPKGAFSHYTVVGAHTITTLPATTSSITSTSKGRYRAFQGGRDVTNRLVWSTSNSARVQVYPGGAYAGVSAGSATVTVTDPEAGTSATITVTVT